MYLPLFFKSNNLLCLIIGAGEVASHKIKILLSTGCNITVIAPDAIQQIQKLSEKSSLKWIRRKYQTGDCRNFDLIIAATSKKDINHQVSTEAQQLRIPVNVIDDPELCTVIFSAVWNDGPLSVAVSSSGVAPFLAAEIRNRIASEGKEWGRRVEIAGRFRDVVRKEVEDSKERTELYKRFIDACVSDKTTEPSYNDSLREWLDWLE